jgi:hypothetical protein
MFESSAAGAEDLAAETVFVMNTFTLMILFSYHNSHDIRMAKWKL